MKKGKMKRWLALLLSLAMILTACGGGGGGDKPADDGGADAEGKLQLVFWHAMGGGIGEALTKIVDEYNASQDKVFVKAEYQGSYDETLTKLRSTASGSSVGADIVQVFEQGMTFMIDSGLTVPVQDYIDKSSYDVSVLESNLLAYYTKDGKLYTMPFNSSTPLMYYNKDIFAKAGIAEAPKTMEELIAIAPDLTSKGEASMAASLRVYGWFIEQWLNKTEDDIFDAGNGREGVPTKVVFDENGGMLKILNMLNTAYNSGYMPNVGREGGQPEFVAGASAVTLASTANLRQILTEVDGRFEVGTAFYPAIDGEDQGGVSIGGASLWMIDSGDQEKMDATWEFIQYLVSPAVQAQWNADTGYFPINTKAHDEQVFKDNLAEFPQFQTAIDQLHAAKPSDQGALSGVNQEARQYFEAELEKMINGEITPEEAVKAMADQTNAAIENYNSTTKK